MKPILLSIVVCCAAFVDLAAQSTISTSDRYAYSANAGWLDFRPSVPDTSP